MDLLLAIVIFLTEEKNTSLGWDIKKHFELRRSSMFLFLQIEYKLTYIFFKANFLPLKTNLNLAHLLQRNTKDSRSVLVLYTCSERLRVREERSISISIGNGGNTNLKPCKKLVVQLINKISLFCFA